MSPNDTPSDFLSELRARGLFQHATHEQALADHLRAGRRSAYVGFDPTADSLTVGNLVVIMLLAHFQRAGHRPVVVVGGGTGLIGDPSGRSAERQLLSAEMAEANVRGQLRIFERLLDFSAGSPLQARILNNHDWLGKLGYIEVLRDIGKHFSVNAMIQRDSVRERLHHREQGISYTEFSYILLQAYDFLHLRRTEGITLQMGGSDQWGNIVSGCDLIRRLLPAPDNEAYGLTSPLLQKADGGKFGKTESGAIWLTADRTSPYAYYQFWLNAEDRDVLNYLRIFTFLSLSEIAALAEAQQKDPGARAAQRALARAATELLHGAAERDLAEQAAQALFTGDIAALPEATLQEVFHSVPSSEHPQDALAAGVPIVEALVLFAAPLVKSRREAREFLQAGSITVNGRKAGLLDRLGTADLLHGTTLAFRRGKKNWHVARFKS